MALSSFLRTCFFCICCLGTMSLFGGAQATAAEQTIVASWYGAPHHGQLMASGFVFDMNTPVAAHRTLPFGTRIQIRNPRNGITAEALICDRGPYKRGRALDVSSRLAELLEFKERGLERLSITVLFLPRTAWEKHEGRASCRTPSFYFRGNYIHNYP